MKRNERQATLVNSVHIKADEVVLRIKSAERDKTLVMSKTGLPWASVRKDCIEDAAVARQVTPETIQARLEAGKKVTWTQKIKPRPVVIKLD